MSFNNVVYISDDVMLKLFAGDWVSSEDPKIILYIIAKTVGGHKSECELSVREIARDTSASIATINRAIRRLCENGYIKRRAGGKNRTYLYSLGSEIARGVK